MVEQMFEHRSKAPISRSKFAMRLAIHGGMALGLVALALGIGVLGYRYIAHLSWVDSLMNASMILGGMGPINEMESDPAKVFASLYALFSGLLFIAVAGLMLAPIAHRILHRFHWDDDMNDQP